MTFLVPIPSDGRVGLPMYIRFRLDESQQDKPGFVGAVDTEPDDVEPLDP